MPTPHIAGRAPMKVSLVEGKNYAFCTCGLSASQPFCDGMHRGSEFKPMKFTADKSQDVWMCLCKQTQNGMKCDGAHKRLPADESASEPGSCSPCVNKDPTE